MSSIKNALMPITIYLGELLKYNTFPPGVRQNQVDWLNWLSHLEKIVVPGALRQVNWLTLLLRDFKATELVWRRFWVAIRQLGAAEGTGTTPAQLALEQLAAIEVDMAVANRRRLFLHHMVLLGRPLEMMLYRAPPVQIDWREEARAMAMEA